jgi:hypothetical protein
MAFTCKQIANLKKILKQPLDLNIFFEKRLHISKNTINFAIVK